MNREDYNEPISLRNVHITDNFWKNEMELVRKEIIPYQWDALNDRVEGASPSFCMRNFKVAGKQNKERKEKGSSFEEPKYTFRGFEALPEDPDHLEDKFYGFVFQDSDFYKWIEAVAYSLTQHPDSELEKLADEAIDIVCAAQQEDGYLDTYYIINGKDKIFSNLRDHHELYCFGHLTEGAVAYYQATGKDKLLKATMRFADYIDNYFGPEEGKCKGYPGHEIAEMALVRLYEVTGEKRYLDLSSFFVEERGKRPYYFDKENHPDVKLDKEHINDLRYFYNQAHLPVREQKEATGHAVRAVYLYSGMADLARIKEDQSMYDACETLWNNIVEEKMYITGGIGGTHLGEAFSFPFDLPNDTAYAETCASIGLVFFARRMLEMKAVSKYADVMELALYNGILSGMALDGKSFFYVNPLEVQPKACKLDERKWHVKPVRQKWFGCACCPPNLARLLSSIGSYAYTEKEDTLYVHLYMGSTIEKKIGEDTATIQVKADFPWNSKVSVEASGTDKKFTIALRMPGWCRDMKATGLEGAETEEKDGYLYITKVWEKGEKVELDFPMEVRTLQADSRVREDIGKVAIMRGPVVYCLEETDNGADLHELLIRQNIEVQEEERDIQGTKVVGLAVSGLREKAVTAGKGSLYCAFEKPEREEVTLRYIPYYTWANRGENEMQVWTRVE